MKPRLGCFHTSRRAGFSLAEVLLTVLIMSGIMLAITQILQAARISRDTIHIIKETQLAGPAIMDMIERDLRGLTTLNRTRQDHLRVQDRVMLGLDGDSLDFVTHTDSLILRQDNGRYLRSDINEVGYRLRPSPIYDDFLELYRREDMGVDDAPYAGGAFSFLHDRVKSLDIQVFDEDGPDADPHDEWGRESDEDIGLPARLEISLTLELKQRVAREQLAMNYARKSMVTYRRVIRLPQALRVDEEQTVVLSIPQAPASEAGTGGAAGGETAQQTIVGGAAGGGGGARGGPQAKGGDGPGGGARND
ncbi:MAG: hypothetical protein CMJ84_07225 [Planctomycetes bacterium]|jgi:type II secretory pathway component PulJ|nr:hypothetical protein [Planctomycetota bacterium]MDP6409515.1 hypothetical protein [Planctomycetota bacterium]